ncbi:MAG: adenylate/guanylate cyclase domain-containing protein [Micropepsaceae bacterium]
MKPTDPLHKPLSAWGLRFDDPEREAQFRAELTARVLTRQRVLIVFAFVIYLVYAVRDIALGPTFGYAPLYLRVFFILPVIGIAFGLTFSPTVRPQFHSVFTAVLVIIVACQGMLSLLYPHYGPTDPAQANRTMSSMMMILAIMTVAGLRFESAVGLGLMATAFWVTGSLAKELSPTLYPTLLLNVLTSFVIGAFVAYWLERAERARFEAQGESVRAREKSEAALFAAIPRHVVNRVAADDRPIAEPFVEAVVVLADLAGFNTLARRIGPKETVRVLDHMFSAFDELGEKRKLGRVRTVGDSYMAVGGAYEGAHGGPAEAAQMAAGMIAIVAEAAKKFDLPLAVRVGVHVGPLIGGVVGQSSPIYDFWGDTLNVVNDLEASSETGKIHCSEPFYWRLGEAWRFEDRGPREFRGVGTLRTFYLLGPVEGAGDALSDGA